MISACEMPGAEEGKKGIVDEAFRHVSIHAVRKDGVPVGLRFNFMGANDPLESCRFRQGFSFRAITTTRSRIGEGANSAKVFGPHRVPVDAAWNPGAASYNNWRAANSRGDCPGFHGGK